ncbi:TPA: hypothetical protein ACE8EQ_001393 [Neisseria gonorrhoeae]
MDGVAVDDAALIRKLERVGVACNLHPADAAGYLPPERVRTSLVGTALPFRAVEFEVQCVRHVPPAGFAVRRHAPVRPYRRLISLYRQQGRGNQVFNGGGQAQLALFL